MTNLNLISIENYILTVNAYEKDATERRNPLTAYALGVTQRNLIRLKVEIQEAQEITPGGGRKVLPVDRPGGGIKLHRAVIDRAPTFI